MSPTGGFFFSFWPVEARRPPGDRAEVGSREVCVVGGFFA